MDKNKRIAIWLPVIIAASIALGIFIGNHYLSISTGKFRSYASGNKINAILDIIDEQYVDTVNMSQLVEGAIPRFSVNWILTRVIYLLRMTQIGKRRT
jgi:C-terminal processing peptidase-3. Serine peptidase. MEROPS family S41A